MGQRNLKDERKKEAEEHEKKKKKEEEDLATQMNSLVFEEGELVLCYEPDPNKEKKIYEARIQKVISSHYCTS